MHQTAPKMFLSTQPAWEPDTALTARAVIHPPRVHQGQRPLTSLVTGETFHNFPPDLPADVPTRGVRCPPEPGHGVAWVAALRSFTPCILEEHSLYLLRQASVPARPAKGSFQPPEGNTVLPRRGSGAHGGRPQYSEAIQVAVPTQPSWVIRSPPGSCAHPAFMTAGTRTFASIEKRHSSERGPRGQKPQGRANCDHHGHAQSPWKRRKAE